MMNAGQGSQFTSFDWAASLKRISIQISMNAMGGVSATSSSSAYEGSCIMHSSICTLGKAAHRPGLASGDFAVATERLLQQ
jgi:hypothetical protein